MQQTDRGIASTTDLMRVAANDSNESFRAFPAAASKSTLNLGTVSNNANQDIVD